MYTREEIVAMPAGRELDAHVAVVVMGVPEVTIVGKHYFIDPLDKVLPPYSTDIAAAWEVVEKLQEKGYEVRIAISHKTIGTAVSLYNHTELQAEERAESVPLAICRAALLSLLKED